MNNDLTSRFGRHSLAGGTLLLSLLAAALPGCGGSGGEPEPELKPSTVSVLSSRPDMVSDNSALIEVSVPQGLQAADLRVAANGRDVTASLKAAANGRLRGVVDGLAVGSNTLTVTSTVDNWPPHGSLIVTNHPRTGPIFSGPQLSPFECRTVEAGLGQEVDTACSIKTRYDWFYYTTGGARLALADPLDARPSDLATT